MIQVDDIERLLSDHTTINILLVKIWILSIDLKWRIRDFVAEANLSERTIYPGSMEFASGWLVIITCKRIKRVLGQKEGENKND